MNTTTAAVNLSDLERTVRETARHADTIVGRGKAAAYKARNAALETYLDALKANALVNLDVDADITDALRIATGQTTVKAVNARLEGLRAEAEAEEAAAKPSETALFGASKRDDLTHALKMVQQSLQRDADRIATLIGRLNDVDALDDETVGGNSLVNMVAGDLMSVLNTSSMIGYTESAIKQAGQVRRG